MLKKDSSAKCNNNQFGTVSKHCRAHTAQATQTIEREREREREKKREDETALEVESRLKV